MYIPTGKEFKIMLMEADLSQKQVWKKAGVSQDATNKWVNGHSSPKLDTVVKLIEAYEELIKESE